MAKESEKQEQMDLIDVNPPNVEKIRKAAKEYKSIVSRRQELTAQEVEAKATIIKTVKEGGVLADSEGVITCLLDDMKIVIKPRNELVRVKLNDDEEIEDIEEEE